MSSILSKANHMLDFNFILNDKERKLVILPELNLDVPQEKIDALKTHPVFTALIDTGVLQVIESDRVVKDVEVSTSQKDIKLTTEQTFKPSLETLMSYKNVGKATAQKVLDAMPEGGWTNMKDFEDSTKPFVDSWIKK